MARRKQDQKRNPLDVNLNLSSLDSPFRTISNISAAAGVLATLFCIGGVVIWFYVLGRSGEISHKILVVEIVVSLILLALNIFGICRIGYDGFLKSAAATGVIHVVLTTIGFYLAGLELMDGAMRFAIYLGIAALMAVLPTMVISVIMWGIMALFGDE
ncbi:MAG TPA: hypothetical protein IAB46_04545 [Candidatus Scybalocola faecigallinarum]|uniref:Uncharacterized protein n=1 Tax=Candidatus Scybalocola faecigallinarum TaxID=2840941 RepID=A0A9D1JQ56_9FIRM|nr:hypothetical protein [Candidatus Scybalocola faecigallinarum]